MKIAIVGGGISGLAAAWYARKKVPKAHITVYEASDRLGGWIQTKEIGEFSFELGPRTFQVARCPLLLEMIQENQLELIYSPTGTRYLWHKGSLHPMQSFWPTLLWAGIHDLFSRKADCEDETIYEFASRRCGKQVAELFFDPMAKGVFGGDIHKLSIRACFPLLHQTKNILKTMMGQKDQGLFTVRGGMGRLIEALARVPDEVYLNTKVDRVEADKVVVALPAAEAATFCHVPFDIRSESMTVVNLGYQGEILPKQGYGYLVPTREKELILGQIWDSSIFPTAGQTKVTTMVKGGVAEALDAMERHLGITQKPDAIYSTEALIPQYEVGHLKRIAAFEQAVGKKYLLTGNYFRGASVEACLRKSLDLFLTE